jgi:O-acetylserine/cysteine efflux transporter
MARGTHNHAMPARSVALVVLVTAIWGVNFVVIHEGLEHFPPLLFNSLRFALMAVPAIFLVGRPRVPWRYVLGIGAALGVVKFGLLFVSIDQGLPVGLSSLLLQLQVVFTIAFAALALGERPRREQVAGAAVAFAGLGVIAIDRAASAPILPFVLVVGAAAAWGVSNTLTRKAQPPDALALLVWASLVAPLPLLGLSLAFEGPAEIGDALAGVDAAAVASLLFVAGVSGLFGFAAWIGLLKRHSAAAVTPFALLVPVFGIASAALLLGERPSGLELGGAVLICAGLAATLLPPRAQRGHARTAARPRRDVGEAGRDEQLLDRAGSERTAAPEHAAERRQRVAEVPAGG